MGFRLLPSPAMGLCRLPESQLKLQVGLALAGRESGPEPEPHPRLPQQEMQKRPRNVPQERSRSLPGPCFLFSQAVGLSSSPDSTK